MKLSVERQESLVAGSPASRLSPNMRHLLRRMWQLGYGTIRRLHVRDGQPVFDPAPAVVRTIRLGQPEPGIGKPACDDFALKQQQLALVRLLADVGTGVIDLVKVHDGLPVGLEIHEQL